MDKQAVREAVWDAFEAGDQARFPFPSRDRITNFAGADAACERLTETAEWAHAETLKCNPDAPQLPVRRAALRAGKTVYVAQPRLRSPDPFFRLDPDAIGADGDATIDDATTVSGISTHGTPVAPEDVSHVDLVVSGSVAVTTDGARIGKGEGYSDLEWGALSELDAVDSEALRASGSEGHSPSGNRAKPDDDGTTVATTVHELSVIDGPESAIDGEGDGDNGAWTPSLPEPDAHDVPLDLIATPERTIRTETPYERPSGIDWDALDSERLDAIPVLAERAPGRE